MLKRLFDAVSQRYSLVELGDASCPIRVLAALPRAGDTAGPGWLPPAARPGSRRAPLGRGLTAEAAALSCLGEAVELVSACAWGNEEIAEATLDDVSDEALTLAELLLVSARQYKQRDIWNARHAGVMHLPASVDPKTPQAWLPARRPADGAIRLVPANYALIGYGHEEGALAYAGNSNGCAAGETAQAASVAGFLELVERDATSIWWYGQHRRPMVDASDLPFAREVNRWLTQLGRTCHFIDISGDLGIPVVAAVSTNTDGSGVTLGFAARFDGEAAVEAALSELCQQVLVGCLRAPVADDRSQEGCRGRSGLNSAQLPFLTGHRQGCLADLQPAIAAAPTVHHCIELCARHGLELLVLDLTRQAIGIPVVRVIVPGLRHTLPGFAPGRLYDVPARLGWERQPQEDDMNPLPLVG